MGVVVCLGMAIDEAELSMAAVPDPGMAGGQDVERGRRSGC